MSGNLPEWDMARIAAAAHAAFVAAFGPHETPMTNRFVPDDADQTSIELVLRAADSLLTTAQIIDSIVVPAAAALAEETPHGWSFLPLELPYGAYRAARHGDGFVSIRVVMGRDIVSGLVLLTIDVLTSPVPAASCH